jgi:hypothetical protein
MRIRALINGNHGGGEFQAGDELPFDSDYIRKLLVNGLAEPLDEDAIGFMARTHQHEEYQSTAFQNLAAELAQAKQEAPAEAEAPQEGA